MSNTVWRPGSRRATVERLNEAWVHVRASDRLAAIDPPPSAEDSAQRQQAHDDLVLYAQEAVAAGYITPEQAVVVVGPDEGAAREVIVGIWDFSTDPAFTKSRILRAQKKAALRKLVTEDQRVVLQGSDKEAATIVLRSIIAANPDYAAGLPDSAPPDWSLDWPEGTPADEIGPGRGPRHGSGRQSPPAPVTSSSPALAATLGPGMGLAIADACAAAAPRAACGIIAARVPFAQGGRPSRVIVTWNAAPDPMHEFEIGGEDLFELVLDLEERREVIWAIFSTDPRGRWRYPSARDVRTHAYPEALRIIATVGPPAAIRAWIIEPDRVEQVSLIGTAEGVTSLERLGSRSVGSDGSRRMRYPDVPLVALERGPVWLIADVSGRVYAKGTHARIARRHYEEVVDFGEDLRHIGIDRFPPIDLDALVVFDLVNEVCTAPLAVISHYEAVTIVDPDGTDAAGQRLWDGLSSGTELTIAWLRVDE